MKLKYSYKLDTWARDDRYNSQNSLTQIIGNCEVELIFDNNHNVTGVNIFFPDVRIMLNERGTVDASLDKEKEVEAHSFANYIANMLYVETGKCDFTKVGTPDYVPETEEDRRGLEGMTFTRSVSISLRASLRGSADLSQQALSRYMNQKDALAMYVDAKKMSNPTGKYREFFRVIEHYFPYEGPRFDRETHNYLVRSDSKYTEGFIKQLRLLRNRCSHAKRVRDYITSNDLNGMKEVQEKTRDVERIAKLLLDNPPS